MQKYAYLILYTNGRIEVIGQDEEELELEKLQKIVGGFIEIVNTRFRTDLTMVVDDEGLLKNKPLNPYATLLYGGVLSGAHIAGDAVLCIRKDYPEPDIYAMTSFGALCVKEILQTSKWRALEQTWAEKEADE